MCSSDLTLARGGPEKTKSCILRLLPLLTPCLDMNDPTSTPRQIVPGRVQTSPTSPTSDSPPQGSQASPTSSWKKRVSTACLACKKSKRKVGGRPLTFHFRSSGPNRSNLLDMDTDMADNAAKCSGVPPCDNCRAFNRVCIFDESLDQRRRVAQKRTAEELNYHRDMLNDLFRVIRTADEPHALKLLEIIRKNATAEEIRAFIDETLIRLDGEGRGAGYGQAVQKLEDVRRTIDVEGADPSFRRKVMDIHYLCDEAPWKVPAKPWTSVTEDEDLVSHLVSLYFTWDYPFHAFLDRDVFLAHMARGREDSDFCSPFLVNALLANACVRSLLFCPVFPAWRLVLYWGEVIADRDETALLRVLRGVCRAGRLGDQGRGLFVGSGEAEGGGLSKAQSGVPAGDVAVV